MYGVEGKYPPVQHIPLIFAQKIQGKMNSIKMVDLYGQYQKIKHEIDEAMQRVMSESAFINGPDVKALQQELATYTGAGHVITCANGTEALQIAMMSLGLKPGDEVITSNFTFIATIEVIALLGLTPVLADVEPDTFNIDPLSVQKAITNKTKAIVPVHLFGQCANMGRLLDICRTNGLYLIEDAAQAVGSEYRFANGSRNMACTMGHFGCTSFFPSKNLGAFGDAGALFTNDEELAHKAKCIANHGASVKYHHSMVGINSRLDTLQAAILRIKLQYLDEYNTARQQAAARYDRYLGPIAGITIPYRAPYSSHVFHQYTILLENLHSRDGLHDFLQQQHIPSMMYYPVPLHLQEAYRYLPYKQGDFPVTEDLCNRVLSLPMHTELTDEQQLYICQKIKEYRG